MEGAPVTDDDRLWFQFSDGPHNFPVHWTDTLEILSSQLCWQHLAGEILVQRTALRGFSVRFQDLAGCDLITVEAAIQHRAVSYALDEPHLIGSPLGLDKGKILDGRDETRMHRLWSLIPSVPRGIGKETIFRDGPRLQERLPVGALDLA